MKKIFTLLTSILLMTLFLSSSMNAQQTDVLNSDVNFQMGVANHAYNGPDDGALDNDADPVYKNVLSIGSTTFPEFCHIVDNVDPPIVFGGSPVIWLTTQPFDSDWGGSWEAFESDSPSNICTFGGGDDDQRFGVYTAQSNRLINPDLSQQVYPCQWNIENLSTNADGWILSANGYYDQKFRMTWRYEDGDTPDNPLEFGMIADGETKSDINSTARVVGTSDSTKSQYSDTFGNDAADVWYTFEISEASDVVISTDYDLITNYNTFLRLYNSNDMEIAFNDDLGFGETSEISEQLSAGSYTILVEGFESERGRFRVSVEVTSAVGIDDNVLASDIKLFPIPNNGSFTIDLTPLAKSPRTDIRIIDIAGRIVHQETTFDSMVNMNLGDIAAGLYSVELINSDQRFIKRLDVRK
jgi:hypothetical protein